MPLSRAEIQKRYRERKKREEGESYLIKDRERQMQKYVPVRELTESERTKRNVDIKIRVRRHREKKRAATESTNDIKEPEASTSGEQRQPRLVIKLPNKTIHQKKHSQFRQRIHYKLRKSTEESSAMKRKLKRLQKKLERLRKTTPSTSTNLTPKSKTKSQLQSVKFRDKRSKRNVHRELMFGNVMLHSLKTKVQSNKNKVYDGVSSSIIKKYRMMSKVSTELNINRNKLSKVIKQGVDFSKARRKRVIAKQQASVTTFLEREDNSRLQPGKNDATKVGNEKVQTRILVDYMANLFQKYKAENPQSKMSLATFCRMRPAYIKLTSFLKRNVCMCTKHQNFSLKLQAMRQHGLDIPKQGETFVDTGTVIEKNQLPEQVSYPTWKRVTLESGKKKMKVVNESQDRDTFYKQWCVEVEAFKEHVHVMRTQYIQTRVLKQNLPPGEIVIHMDFAENYCCKVADEIQSAYWNVTQVTLHPMVIYYTHNDTGTLEHKSYVAISDELSHASPTVLAIIKRLLNGEIDLPGCNEIRYVHYWTDSPTSQYRNRFIFSAVANHEQLFGCPATWNYYEAGHGKNVCDGLGGTVKRMADEAVRSGRASIQDAVDFLQFAKSSSMKGVHFYFVTTDECENMASEVKKTHFPVIKGTLRLHSVKASETGLFYIRDTSCYCDTCISGLVCETWRTVDVGVKQNKRSEFAVHEHDLSALHDTRQPSDSTESNSYCPTQVDDDLGGEDNNLHVRVDLEIGTGDYVACRYDEHWYIGKVLQEDNGEYEISFMKKQKAMFQWPSREDVIWVNSSDILCKIGTPVPSGKSKRMFMLDREDIDRINGLFN